MVNFIKIKRASLSLLMWCNKRQRRAMKARTLVGGENGIAVDRIRHYGSVA
jgi:hypothetical protein